MKKYCSYCRGFKVQFADPEGKKLIKCKVCNGTGNIMKREERR